MCISLTTEQQLLVKVQQHYDWN